MIIIKKTIFISFFFAFALSINAQITNKSIDIQTLFKMKPRKAISIISKELLNDSLDIQTRTLLLEYKADILKEDKNIFSAIDLYNESLYFNKNLNNIETQIRVLNKISELYIITEDFSKVIDNLNIVEKLLGEINSSSDFKSSDYTANLAALFYKTGEIEKAKKHYHYSFNLAKSNNNYHNLNKHYLKFSSLYLEEKLLDSALFYSNKVLNYSIINNKLQLKAEILIIQGSIYEEKQDFIKAEDKFIKALKILEKLDVNSAFIYKKLGEFYKKVHLYDNANKYLSTAVKKSSKLHNTMELQSLFHNLIENSLLQNNSKKASKYLSKLDSINRIRAKEIETKNIAYINERYNIQQAEIKFLNDRNTLLKKQRELLNQKEIAKKNKLLFIIIIILLLVIGFITYLYSKYKKLDIEKSNIQLKNSVLRLQMNPHFIFNSLTAIQNSILKNNPLKSAELIAVFSKLIRQNLEFSTKESISLVDEIDMLTNYLETQKFRFDDLFNFILKIDHDIDQDATQIPPMLLQPFIENSIEHGVKHIKKDGMIKIIISKIENGINIIIEDNGVGREESIRLNKKYNDTNKIRAIMIFTERLKFRQKNEVNSFIIKDVVNKKGKVKGTKIEFNLMD